MKRVTIEAEILEDRAEPRVRCLLLLNDEVMLAMEHRALDVIDVMAYEAKRILTEVRDAS